MQEFNGTRYYKTKRGYYRAAAGGSAMHRVVWEHCVGPIPEGHHIHHVDGDRGNNNISNLECLSAETHAKLHWNDEEHRAARCEEISRAAKGKKRPNNKISDKARKASAAWHRSEEGRRHHKELGKLSWSSRKMHTLECQECGTEYETPWPTRSKYCHQNCKMRARTKRLKEEMNND